MNTRRVLTIKEAAKLIGGLRRLMSNNFRFTISGRTAENLRNSNKRARGYRGIDITYRSCLT